MDPNGMAPNGMDPPLFIKFAAFARGGGLYPTRLWYNTGMIYTDLV